jgi:hypothetical protein
MSDMPKAAASVVRVRVGKRFGSGLQLAPGYVLTADHVIGAEPQGESAYVESSAWSMPQRVHTVHRYPAGARDIAVIEIPKDIIAAPGAPIASSQGGLVSVGDEVVVTGFSTADRDMETDRAAVASFDKTADCYVLNKSLPEGFSGSPIFVDGIVVGVVFARNFSAGRAYFYRVDAWLDFVRACCGDALSIIEGKFPSLRRYPRGPMVPRHDVFGMCGELITYYKRAYRGYNAEALVAKANSARRNADPEVRLNGLLDLDDLPDPNSPPTFWPSAFAYAGLKSPRLLAALIEASDEESLSTQERRARSEALRTLETWSGTP